MLHIPPNSKTTAFIVGIDPGSEMLGVSVFEFDIRTMAIVRCTAKTLQGSKLMRKHTLDIDLHGERQARVKALKEALIEILLEYEPIQIAVESPFFSARRPSAYGVLMEVLIAVKEAVYFYNSWRVVYLIDPPTVKKAVGAPGNADKDKVKAAIMLLLDLHYEGETPLELLDEHSLDSLAVGYCRIKELAV